MDDLHPVVVAEVRTAQEAAFLRHRLEQAGIRTLLDNQHTAAVHGGIYVSALGGVKITVPAADAQRASRILGAGRKPTSPTGSTRADWLQSAWITGILGLAIPLCSLLALFFLVAALRRPGPWPSGAAWKVAAAVVLIPAGPALWGLGILG